MNSRDKTFGSESVLYSRKTIILINISLERNNLINLRKLNLRKNKLEDYFYNKRVELNNLHNVKCDITLNYQLISIKTPDIDLKFNCYELKEILNNKFYEGTLMMKGENLEIFTQLLKKELSENNIHILDIYNNNIHIFISIMLENTKNQMISNDIIVKLKNNISLI